MQAAVDCYTLPYPRFLHAVINSFFLIISKIIASFYLRASLFASNSIYAQVYSRTSLPNIKTYFGRCVSTNNVLIRNAMLPVYGNSADASCRKKLSLIVLLLNPFYGKRNAVSDKKPSPKRKLSSNALSAWRRN